MSELEYKMSQCSEIKSLGNKDNMSFEGYLAVFGNVDSCGDVIEKGAFLRTLNELKEENKTLFVIENHGGWGLTSTDYTPIGFFEDIYEDEYGLKVKGKLYSNDKGKSIYIMLKESPKGAIGMSIGYSARGYRWASENRGEKDEKGAVRYLTDIDLREGSIVTFPANDKAVITDVKSMAMKKREIERVLKENGFSNKDAATITAIVSRYVDSKSVTGFSYDEIKKVNEAHSILQKAYSDLGSLLGIDTNSNEEIKSAVKTNGNTLLIDDKDSQELHGNEVKSLLDVINDAKETIQNNELLFAIDSAKNSLKM